MLKLISFVFLYSSTALACYHANFNTDFPPPEHVKHALRTMPELASKEIPQMPNFTHLTRGDVFMVYAHTDDELPTLAATGALRAKYPERKFHWILVSDSAAGLIKPGTCRWISPEKCRYNEAKRAGRCFGLQKPHAMRLPDGKLQDVPNLHRLIWDDMMRLSEGRGIAAIFTHDPAGLYGHPDHVAVYDAIQLAIQEEQQNGKQAPAVVTVALTNFIKSVLPRRPPGSERPLVDITHVLDLSNNEIEKMACATLAHASQQPTIAMLLMGLSPHEFWESTPRVYLNVQGWE